MGNPGLSFRVNPLFLIIIAIFSFAGILPEIILAFAIVLFHEFVHLLTAYYYGYSPGKIEIFPFGGIAEYIGIMEMEPAVEIKVALAGPLFNLAIGGVAYLLNSRGMFINQFSQQIINYNLLIGLFNLLPALPLDGGRVFRSILVFNLGFKKGTIIAVKTSKVLALFGACFGIYAVIFNQSNLWYLLIAFFVYGAAVREEKQFIYYLLRYLTHREEYLKGLEIKEVSARVIKGSLKVKRVINYLNPTKYNIFLVLNSENEYTGMITENLLIKSFFSLQKDDLTVNEII